ncbi:UNVERIFIED_CONTAM: hypothetical protein Scaly_2716100 [Sesamum calycinum]|uniref:Helitron helicase-like domain-containing protein n=1 Tax=Sesamum calycinum TaxID=2727403 RepID=A0AAW2J4A6_9LAMI
MYGIAGYSFDHKTDIHVIEFQKRGLPHPHITLTVADQDKPVTPEDINEFICAEIPNKNVDPLAYETVVRSMVHGPCGPYNLNAPCMVDGKCSKHYPKKFSNQTIIDEDGFISYRRRNNPEITDPVGLLERHWRAMTDDLQYRVRRELRDNSVHISDKNLKEWGLHEIECILNRNGKTLGDFPPMPLPSSRSFGIITNWLIRKELDYDSVAEE